MKSLVLPNLVKNKGKPLFLIQYYTQVEHVQVQVQEQVQPAAYNKSYDKSSALILSTQIIFMLPPFHTYSIIYIYVKYFFAICVV